MRAFLYPLLIAVSLVLVPSVKAGDRYKTLECAALLGDPAWRDYQSCLEYQGANVLLCSPMLLRRLTAEKQSLAKELLLNRMGELLTENGIPFSVDVRFPGSLKIEPNAFAKTFPRFSSLIEKAQGMEVTRVSDFLVSIEGTEFGYSAFYNQKTNQLGITALGLSQILAGDPEMFLTVRHELGHAYLSKSESPLNTTVTIINEIPGKPGERASLVSMPEGYNHRASFQETYTYSREIEAYFKAIAHGIESGKVVETLYADALSLVSARPLFSFKTLNTFMPGFKDELLKFRARVENGSVGLLFHSGRKEIGILSSEGKMLEIGGLALSEEEIQILTLLEKFQSLQTPETLLLNNLGTFARGTPEYRAFGVSLTKKILARLCVLDALVTERAKTFHEIQSSAESELQRLLGTRRRTPREMAAYFRSVARMFESGVKKPALLLLEEGCRK